MSLVSDTVHTVLQRLLAEGALEITPGQDAAVLEYCVAALSDTRPGAQLVDTLVRALLRCPDVSELYATNEQIKDYITDSRSSSCPTSN